ncbi:MAG: cysteine desulfurase family protein [Oscillospiraceae bacterium]
MSIYFDNSATTRVSQRASEKAVYLMRECFGNPSSLHTLGFLAEKEIAHSREAMAKAMGVLAKEIYFTSGGTESNNTALFGAAQARRKRGNHILTSAIEHPSVLETMKMLEQDGFAVEYLQPQADGNILESQIQNAISKDTILVSLMSVNNETGALLPLQAVLPAIRQSGAPALFHVDNVQGFGKQKLNVKRLGIDLMSVSGHKIHAPKGVGALYVGSGARILPHVFGGGQEKNLRPGTENAPGICAMGEAVQEFSVNGNNVSDINLFLRNELKKLGLRVNSPENASPYILNFSTGTVRGETMLHFFAQREIYVSTGSACSKAKPSHVLTAMGLGKEILESSLRLSFCDENTMEEATEFLHVLTQGLCSLQSRSST